MLFLDHVTDIQNALFSKNPLSIGVHFDQLLTVIYILTSVGIGITTTLSVVSFTRTACQKHQVRYQVCSLFTLITNCIVINPAHLAEQEVVICLRF